MQFWLCAEFKATTCKIKHLNTKLKYSRKHVFVPNNSKVFTIIKEQLIDFQKIIILHFPKNTYSHNDDIKNVVTTLRLIRWH